MRTNRSESSGGEDEDEELCAICMTNPANHLVVPCGHKCGCEECLKTLQGTSSSPRCPICRTRITSIVKVINSGYLDGSSESHNNVSGSSSSGNNSVTPLATPVGMANIFDLPDISLKVLPIDVDSNRNGVEEAQAVVRVKVCEPDEGSLKRLPVDVVVVIDISGSMGTDATYEVNGEEKSDGLSILNVAQHAVKVVIASLKKEDRFSIVAFDQTAELKFPLTNLTAKGSKDAIKACEDLRERGQTNIWAGISKGLDQLRTAKKDGKHPDRNKVILLLTDGRPTTSPRGGHIKAFQEYCSKNRFKCQLSCFGFGYSLDSNLLLELSEFGGGPFAFIPTAPVLGTVFSHALASILSTYTTNSKLILKIPKNSGVSFSKTEGVFGGLEIKRGFDENIEIDLGALLFGQTRDVIVPLKFSPQVKNGDVFLEAKLEYSDPKKFLTAKGKDYSYDTDAEIAKLRGKLTDVCREVVHLGEIRKLEEGKKKIKELEKEFNDSDEAFDERVVGLKKDITGRVSKALTGRPRFNRWGKHYIRALLRAHSVQQCTNDLDCGVQVYGGGLFSIMRQRGDAIFLNLPAPQPPNPRCPICGRSFPKSQIEIHTNRCMNGGGGFSTGYYSPTTTTTTTTTNTTTSSLPRRSPSPPRTVSMNTYTTGGGGCFGGESIVKVLKGSEFKEINVKDVKKGDFVKVSGSEKVAKVECIIEVYRKDEKPLVAIPNGPLLTPKHPVKINGKWTFPDGLGPRVSASQNGKVFNFILEPRNAILLVNGFQCVTLGHGLGGEIVEHSFYGSERVVNEIKKLSGWKNGKVEIDKIIRDKDGHAKGFTESV